MIMAVLAMAGCDAGNSKDKQAPSSQSQAQIQARQARQAEAPAAGPKWFIQMNSREAVSDISAWLLERGYAPVIVVVEGKQQMLVGPYESEAAAQEQRVVLQAKVAKSHRLAEPSVVQRAE
jgi:hypothetical protein